MFLTDMWIYLIVSYYTFNAHSVTEISCFYFIIM